MHAHAPVNYKCMTRGEWFGREKVSYLLDIPISKIRQVSSRSLRLPESQYVIISWKKSVGDYQDENLPSEIAYDWHLGLEESSKERNTKVWVGQKAAQKPRHRPQLSAKKERVF